MSGRVLGAVLEVLIRVGRDGVSTDPVPILIQAPDRLVTQARGLPKGWAELPCNPGGRPFGERWVTQSRSAALLAPSVVLQGELNRFRRNRTCSAATTITGTA